MGLILLREISQLLSMIHENVILELGFETHLFIFKAVYKVWVWTVDMGIVGEEESLERQVGAGTLKVIYFMFCPIDKY